MHKSEMVNDDEGGGFRYLLLIEICTNSYINFGSINSRVIGDPQQAEGD